MPSWITSRMSHISFEKTHFKTLKNSLEFKPEEMIFLAMQTY